MVVQFHHPRHSGVSLTVGHSKIGSSYPRLLPNGIGTVLYNTDTAKQKKFLVRVQGRGQFGVRLTVSRLAHNQQMQVRLLRPEHSTHTANLKN